MISVIEGAGRDTDRAQDLADAIMAAVEEHAQGMRLAVVIGTLELVKMTIVLESEG